MKLETIDTSKLRIAGLLGETVEKTINKNIYKLNIDNDFISPFKSKDCDIEYVGTGLLIESLARLSFMLKEVKLLRIKDKIINEIIKSQLDDGYIGALKKENRVWGKWDIQEVSYIIHGLLINYELFKHQQSLEAAEKAG